MTGQSIYERMNDLHGEMAQLIEDMGETIYSAIESDALKRLAIDAGVDHTIEPTKIIENLGHVLQRERDLNRELRRQLTAVVPASELAHWKNQLTTRTGTLLARAEKAERLARSLAEFAVEQGADFGAWVDAGEMTEADAEWLEADR